MHGQHLQETATLLQKGARKSDRSAEEIAADALKHMQALSGLIDEIQGKEDAEMSSLVATEKKRWAPPQINPTTRTLLLCGFP